MNNSIENQGGSRCCRKKSQQGPEKVVVLGPGSTTYFGYGRFKPKNLTWEPKAFGRRVHTADNHTNTCIHTTNALLLFLSMLQV